MTRIRTLAASAIACSCLLYALPALAAAPMADQREQRTAGPVVGAELQLVQWRSDRDGDRQSDRDRRRDGDRDRNRDRDRDQSRDHSRDRDRDGDRNWDRDRGRDGDRDRYGDWRRERDRYHWDYDYRERWRTGHHPRKSYWAGRKLPPQGRYYVIRDYGHYHLPPPPRGHYYVRNGDDVFLVLEATRTIIDAFILLELLGR